MSKKKEIKSKKRPKKECPYDDWTCRIYSLCGTKKCINRARDINNAGFIIK